MWLLKLKIRRLWLIYTTRLAIDIERKLLCSK